MAVNTGGKYRAIFFFVLFGRGYINTPIEENLAAVSTSEPRCVQYYAVWTTKTPQL
jgi:hypothetical protein